jgi:hypothetical protein
VSEKCPNSYPKARCKFSPWFASPDEDEDIPILNRTPAQRRRNRREAVAEGRMTAAEAAALDRQDAAKVRKGSKRRGAKKDSKRPARKRK